MNLRAYLARRLRQVNADNAALRAELVEVTDRLARAESVPQGRAMHLCEQMSAALGEWCGLMDGSLPPSEAHDVRGRSVRLRAEAARPWPPVPDGRSVVERATAVTDDEFEALRRRREGE